MTLFPPRWRSLDLVLVAVGTMVAAVASACIGLGHILPVVLIVSTAAAGLLLTLPSIRRMALPVLGMLSIMLASSTAVIDSSALVSVAMRLGGMTLLLLACRRMASPGTRMQTGWLVPVVLALGVYLILSMGFHGEWTDLVSYGIGLVLFAMTFTTLGQRGDARLFETSAMVALQLVLASSIMIGVALPSVGIEQHRLRGVIENANLLGFFAFLTGALAVSGSARGTLRVSGLGLSVIAIAWTASRGSALALAIVIALFLATRRPVTLVGVAVATAIGALLIAGFFPSSLALLDTLLRDTNSRSDAVDSALAQWQQNPVFGSGDLPENDIIASSPLRALANAGTGGALVVLTLWATILRFSWRRGLAAASLGLAAVAHSLLEGWLLSPVGSLLIMFFVVWSTVLRPQPDTSPECTVDGEDPAGQAPSPDLKVSQHELRV